MAKKQQTEQGSNPTAVNGIHDQPTRDEPRSAKVEALELAEKIAQFTPERQRDVETLLTVAGKIPIESFAFLTDPCPAELSVDERLLVDAYRRRDYHRATLTIDNHLEAEKHAEEQRRARRAVPVQPYSHDDPSETDIGYMTGLEAIGFDVAGALLKGCWLPLQSLYRGEMRFGELCYDITGAVWDSLIDMGEYDLDELDEILLRAKHHKELSQRGQEADETDD
jgi:hypothetical protein